jgi:glycosyltransferase involved in cell wall biosynthesis
VHGEAPPAGWDAYTERVAAGLQAADIVIAPTRTLLDDVCREYGLNPPARVIPNGSTAVDMVADRSVKEPLVLTAGRLWDDAKNVSMVCAAAPAVSWPVCLAGHTDGPSGAFACSGGARYLGRLSRDQMLDWYRRAAIYALPARYEPFGLSVLEAAAAGCALVLGDIRTLRENWTGAAVFVPPDNRRALAQAIQRLIDEPVRREQLARLARERAARFTIDAMADGYLETYNRLLRSAVAA